MNKILIMLALFYLSMSPLFASWLKISNMKVELQELEKAGHRIVISFELSESSLSERTPAYVFVRYRRSAFDSWKLLTPSDTRGDGHGIVSFPGHRRILWWGVGPITQDELDSGKAIPARTQLTSNVLKAMEVKTAILKGGPVNMEIKNPPLPL